MRQNGNKQAIGLKANRSCFVLIWQLPVKFRIISKPEEAEEKNYLAQVFYFISEENVA